MSVKGTGHVNISGKLERSGKLIEYISLKLIT
jgi:hypothetical protein